MIITRTPYRISFFGGGSDYPSWYAQHGGCVLGATINKYCWLTVRKPPPFGKPYKLIYSRTEECDCVGDIQHPAIRATIEDLGYRGEMELFHSSDLPARSGVGSSSAFVVGLINAIRTLYPDEEDKKHLFSRWDVAREAMWIEQIMLNETVGSQDQILCSYGGFRIIDFPREGNPTGRDICKFQQEIESCARVLERHLLLFYTGIQRTASDVASGYVPDLTGEHEKTIRVLMEMVDEGAEIIRGISRGKSPDRFGVLLDRAWNVKKLLKGVTTPEINSLYSKAYIAGALGGKIMGAGGGGFLLFYVPLDRQKAVREALKGLVEVPFKFEYDGSCVVYNRKES